MLSREPGSDADMSADSSSRRQQDAGISQERWASIRKSIRVKKKDLPFGKDAISRAAAAAVTDPWAFVFKIMFSTPKPAALATASFGTVVHLDGGVYQGELLGDTLHFTSLYFT